MSLYSMRLKSSLSIAFLAALALVPALLVGMTLWCMTNKPLSQPRENDTPLQTETITPGQPALSGAIDPVQLVREALKAEPKLIEEALLFASQQKTAEENLKRQKAVADNRELILSTTNQVVLGNQDAQASTLVEFFDYNCGYCRKGLADILALLETRPDIRIILREFPVLGDDSVDAARVAIAVHRQNGDYLAFHKAG
jgi:protein-disulfide isomerase